MQEAPALVLEVRLRIADRLRRKRTGRLAGHPLRVVERHEDLGGERLDERLPRLGGDRRGDVVGVGEQDAERGAQERAALPKRRPSPPLLLEPGLRDELRDCLDPRALDGADGLERRRIDGGELPLQRDRHAEQS